VQQSEVHTYVTFTFVVMMLKNVVFSMFTVAAINSNILRMRVIVFKILK